MTRGRIQVGGRWVFDGGYADAIPLNRSLEDGNKRIVVVRTRPAGLHVEQGTLDWLASYWFRDNEAMAKLFESSHEHYNSVVGHLRDEGNGTAAWSEIAPYSPLRSDGYSMSASDVRADYRHGMEAGLDWFAANPTD